MKKATFALFVLCFSVFITEGQVTESDSLVLVALYDSTDGENWTVNTNWLQPGFPVSTWYGIRISQDSVVDIELSENNLTGTIPIQIGELGRLSNLSLQGNQLTGPIPSEIGNLANLLYLNLGDNNLTDSIPPELGKLDKILTINLMKNQLTGPLPRELGNLSTLVSLVLSFNLLTDSIPEEIGNLYNLTWLDLSHNQLSGSIPHEIGTLSNLRYLYLYSNQLSDSIPVELFNLSNLVTLSLYSNGLTGIIPPEIVNLSNLEYLILNENQLTGSIPADIGTLTKLVTIYLHYNQFTDSIPYEIGKLSNLQTLQVFSNQLSGSIPPEIGNLSSLKNLSLYNNKIEGSIPHEIGKLSNLEYLHLQNNQLNDSIPPEIGNLSKLKSLNLNNNKLTGIIPEEIGELNDLTYLRLKNNKLGGPIPDVIKTLPVLSDIDISNNYFTFYDLEPLTGFTTNSFNYSPQLQVAVEPQYIYKNTGDDVQLNISDYAVPEIVAVNNMYKWWLDNDSITTYFASPVLELTGLSDMDSGYYYCSMINTDFPDLTIYTDVIHLVLDALVNIILDPDSVDENVSPNYIIGTLTTDDPDQEADYTFMLTEGDGSNDADNDLFAIDGANLIITVSPDYEIKQEYFIYVRATDENTKTFDKALVVYVKDLDETGNGDEEPDHIKIYPNPAFNTIQIELPAISGQYTVELYDINGKTIFREERFLRNEIDIRNCPAGLYYIRVINDEQLVTKKIVKGY